VSHENPGKDNRCDHCDQPGVPYTYRGIEFDGLHSNRGERLCSRCLDVAVQVDFDAPTGPMQVPARDYITPSGNGRGLPSRAKGCRS
jgi:hypothetical protein